MKKFLLASAAVMALTVPAAADQLEIVVNEGGFPTQTFIGTGFLSTGTFTLGDFTINQVSAASPPITQNGVLSNSQTINIDVIPPISGNPVSLTIDVLTFGTDPLSPQGLQTLATRFDSVGLTTGWTLASSVFLNGAFIDGTTFTDTGGVGPNFNPADFGAGVWTLDAQYSILTNGGAGAINAGIRVDAVPGPIVGAGLPGLLGMLGFGGFKFWRRRKVA
jgi:hypothetical protein